MPIIFCVCFIRVSTEARDLVSRQDKRATAVEGNPKAPFSLASTVTYGINRNSRQGGAPLLSRCVHNLSPVILVLILPTTNGFNNAKYKPTNSSIIKADPKASMDGNER